MPTSQKSRCCVALAVVLVLGTSAQADDQSAAKEQDLIGVLQSGQPADKAMACKQLAIHGSKAACPELAKLLADEQLASWARIALEAIPDPAANEALRKASETLKGRLLVGTINSLGVRRDAGAVDQLTDRLKEQDVEVAAAAAVALGRVGNDAATKTLRQSLVGATEGTRSAVAEGCILCAERLMTDGKTSEAAEIYDEVRAADVPKPRKLEATRGAILARKIDGIPLLIEQLKSADKDFMQIGLTAARELPGREVADALAAELARTTPDRAALLLYALSDRKDAVVSPAVLAAAKSGDTQIRIAAIGLIGRSGDASSLPTLLEIATDANAELSQASKTALASLPGEKVNAEIAALLPKAEGKTLPVLIHVIGERQIEATPALVKSLDHTDTAIRNAALTALGETVGQKDLAVLISQVLNPKSLDDAQITGRALQAACVRMPDREACAAELASAMQRASVPTKTKLLAILGAMGGPKALQTIAATMKGSDDELQDAGSRVLGEWMSVDAGPVLLDLAKTASGDKYQVRAMRGYIRLARQFKMPDAQRAEMCQKALDAAGRGEEQKLVLAVLERYPSSQTLQVAVDATKVPGLKEDAGLVALAIAHKLGDSTEAKSMLTKAGIEPPNLEIIKAEYGAGRVQKDVTAILRKLLGGAGKVTLPTSSYNQAFGDPAPGTAKQLKIQYTLNGKPGEATFAENAAITLPTPK